ncbi:MAG TPA: patatin-like phospholipase family protein, partial [Blastocatellia bacterium]|nr:patatin-like phospholipase family protein [Blastocatellia bacterium]
MNKICVLLLALTLLAFDASAQSVQVIAKETRSPQTGGVTTGPKEHLKVGLVLSGGGARGIAHIGVLEWFERHRIPVDYVAGTSMGGLVGGMYATGMTPGEMREFLKKIDWDRAFGGGPSYEQLSFRRKEDRNSYQANVEVGLRNGIQIPPRLSSAHYIGLMIDRMMLPYANLSSFDELPIPFRCMATDFLSGQPVVLKDGSISSALRATMSIPGVFPPVERDGRVLVDGGLLNNIPTNVMRQMGPDILIAVDAGTPLGDVKTISTLLGILEQSVTVMTLENDRRNLRLADIIIAPELGNQSPLEFSDVDKLADLGYQAAEAKAAILKRFALDEADWQAYLARRQARRRASAPIADGLQIDGVDASAQEPIRKRLN